MFETIKNLFKKKAWEDQLTVQMGAEGMFYIVKPDGTDYAGPYKREKDAKGQITRLKRTYTPASRHPNG